MFAYTFIFYVYFVVKISILCIFNKNLFWINVQYICIIRFYFVKIKVYIISL